MSVRKVNKNLELIGAFFVNSTVHEDWPEPVRSVMEQARNEMTSTLEDEQYDLYEKAGEFKVTLEA